MTKRKIKFTVVDFILIISVALLLFTFFLKYVNLERFNSQSVLCDADVTVAIRGIERVNFAHFKNDDSIYSDFLHDYGKLGVVTAMRSNPSVTAVYRENSVVMTPDFERVDIYLTIDADVLCDRNGFYSVGGKYIAPGMKFTANNGRIKFDCSVLTVKTK